ncbi:hypothetical protein CRV15_01240 [Streptomyces clavuligerus]|uniref:Uncharacterized protein n=1 Tax=Streptomyces clavuligerus TaxID=1901 RepID=B5GWR8_STRCL|nr:hypothetical protein D1794_01240 [Streptomyces clavuligerus]EDY50764.1 hypothetical protein SSCG_03444 [Streptomyces clavuligerus]EFG10541.1 Hypothetical protein SCLAV_5474 [Streptomyces clavuligerus]QCS04335.1 hypothetical protein CRV15_01240 [Streptomyces clavuligerus]QPJ96278.1 hypothetical protein GE265_26630 [Streptomyces clavuligerus]
MSEKFGRRPWPATEDEAGHRGSRPRGIPGQSPGFEGAPCGRSHGVAEVTRPWRVPGYGHR